MSKEHTDLLEGLVQIDQVGKITPLTQPTGIPGMELRDWFAGKALASMSGYHNTCNSETIAASAYDLADAMMRAREKCNQAGNS